MSNEALLASVKACISDRSSRLTETEIETVNKEILLFESLAALSIPVNELAVLLAKAHEPIYRTVQTCLCRSHEVAGLGCLSSCLSSSTIVNVFWKFGLLGVTGTSRNLIVGRGHTAPAFYAARYCNGGFPLCFIFSIHEAVPAVVNNNWGFANTMYHSLGEGIAMSIGRALLTSRQGSSVHYYCFSGDGELNEGICFEAIRIAYENDVRKYTLVVDDNESGIERLKKPLNIEYIESFFDKVHIIDKPHTNLLKTLEDCTERGLREAIICKTEKGLHSYKRPDSPLESTTGSAIVHILIRLKKDYNIHVITPDLAGRFGLTEDLEYINTGLSEQASVAMTLMLPADDIKFVLTDDKFLLNSIGCIQSAMLSVTNLQIIAARRNDVWGGPVSTPNIFTSMDTLMVYELCDPDILDRILRDRIKARESTVYLFSDQPQKSIASLKTGYRSIGRDFLYSRRGRREILLISTESFASKVKSVSDHYAASHLRVLCRRPHLIDEVREIIDKFQTIVVYEYNSSVSGFGEYLRSVLVREIHIISVDCYELSAIRPLQERASGSTLEQLIDSTARYINVRDQR